jgi:hypothetical protein
LKVETAAGSELTSINIESTTGILTGEAAQHLNGSFDMDTDNNIFKATFGGSFGSLSFGNVAQPGLSQEFLRSDLKVTGSLAAGGDLGNVDLVYVPEPSALALFAIGLLLSLIRLRWWGRNGVRNRFGKSIESVSDTFFPSAGTPLTT